MEYSFTIESWTNQTACGHSKLTGRLLPSCVFLSGEYGVKDIYGGVPVRLGAGGVKQIIEVDLTVNESEAFKKSCKDVEENIKMYTCIHVRSMYGNIHE